MARRSGSSKRQGPNALQIVTWVIVLLVVVSMILASLPVGR
jgi:hypothetical protein